jgi:hypothetical protein
MDGCYIFSIQYPNFMDLKIYFLPKILERYFLPKNIGDHNLMDLLSALILGLLS